MVEHLSKRKISMYFIMMIIPSQCVGYGYGATPALTNSDPATNGVPVGSLQCNGKC